ncbi:ATP-binding protein [Marinobacter sp. CHS3-4]|uniref:HAMP domain-containing hybrid sensor histidine kinase/response regulator n=1 Tax=Marinobacter sp. CHS3-4 TaxID=3045174 RepID=UPI0024B545E9|nr:ATP-binding protein [Marinobacter sp. CHS3-4]MDI9245304.1 ATP-binding protein [Marinobacter sp. CHS3-4]
MNKSPVQHASLTRKLLLLGAAPAIVMFVVLMLFFTSARLEDARREIAASSQMMADSLAPAVEYAVVSGNEEALHQTLDQSLQQSRADWIRVSNVVGQEVGFATVNGDQSISAPDDYIVFESEILQQPLELGGNRESEWFQPQYGFDSGAMRVGSVEVGVHKDRLAERRADIIWTSLAVGLFLLMFTMVIVNYILGGIIAPIRALTRRVERLTNREYDQVSVSEKGSAREIMELEERFNDLAAHLSNLKADRDETLASTERARERAVQANRTKTEFLATMSHELRTPLNGVLGMIDLVSEDPLTERQKDYLLTAKQSTEDLLMVISDILDYSLIDRGTLQLENRRFDLKQVISNCSASYRHIAEKQGLVLETEFQGDWPEPAMVMGDAARLRQILSGLIDNAIKFTNDGSIKVNATWINLEDNCALLNCSVKDSGRGIPDDRLQDVFNSFEQIDTTDSRQYGGTGMGLSLVQRLVELMGGHVKVETDLGVGSVFRFELPFELTTYQPSDEPAKTFQGGYADGRSKALVVEDNLVNQRVAKALLKRLGFETDTAVNGQEAIDLVQSNHAGYDVILMDCQMPIMDGYETTRTIREWEKSNGQGGTPIIALTADALPGTETQCREAGMNDYMAKPVRKESLRQVLSRWISL